jgi:hypothetical protein
MLTDIETIVKDVTAAETDCGLGITRRESNGNCVQDLENMATEVYTLIGDVAAKKAMAVVEDIFTVIKDVKTAEADCAASLDDVNSISGCIADVEGAINAVEDVIA